MRFDCAAFNRQGTVEKDCKLTVWSGRYDRSTLRQDMKCTKVAVAGVSSEVGKTTLLCELLREFPGWEAIKMTRGHYRSCGKDPHACCVSHLLGDEPLI